MLHSARVEKKEKKKAKQWQQVYATQTNETSNLEAKETEQQR